MESSALESRLGTPSPPCCADLPPPPSPLFLRIQTPLGIRTRLSRRRRSTTSVSFSAFLLNSDFDFVLFCHLFSFWFLRMRMSAFPSEKLARQTCSELSKDIYMPGFIWQENCKKLYKKSILIENTYLFLEESYD